MFICKKFASKNVFPPVSSFSLLNDSETFFVVAGRRMTVLYRRRFFFKTAWGTGTNVDVW